MFANPTQPNPHHTHDQDMIPTNMANEYNVSLFLYLNNDIGNNILLPNVDAFTVLRNKGEVDMNLRNMFSMATKTDGT